MKRRSFVKSSLLTGLLPATALSAAAETQKKKQEYYELRTYTLANEGQQQLVEAYWREAAIPALGRIGNRPVGVFTEVKPQAQPKFYVLIPFRSLEDYGKMEAKLMKDKAYLQAANAYLHAPAEKPAYQRIESSLLLAFSHMPRIEAPAQQPRIFELRRYESPNESGGLKKIEMFNEGGEIAIFRRTGLTPVFFGQALIGPHLPNLTYMLTFRDQADRDRSWKQFVADPEWKRISSLPEYADKKILSKIEAVMLQPTDFSQI